MLTRPFTRLVVAFGNRTITQRRIVEEIVLGCLFLVPCGLWIGIITIRLCAKKWTTMVLSTNTEQSGNFKDKSNNDNDEEEDDDDDSGYETVRKSSAPFQRFCISKVSQWFTIRSDIWTTIIIFLVGDLVMELLLSSLQCLPLEHQSQSMSFDPIFHQQISLEEPSTHTQPSTSNVNAAIANTTNMLTCYSFQWILQSYGIYCPSSNKFELLLAPDAMALLFTIRLLFLCFGVYIGESFFPIALTGGIACGKSTVSRLLVQYNHSSTHTNPSESQDGESEQSIRRKNRQQQQQQEQQQQTNINSSRHKKKNKRTRPESDQGTNIHSSGGYRRRNKRNKNIKFMGNTNGEEEKEGTVYLVCADSIAHEILLPPQLLQQRIRRNVPNTQEDDANTENDSGNETKYYTVNPNESVYYDVVRAFGGQDIFMNSTVACGTIQGSNPSSSSSSSVDHHESNRRGSKQHCNDKENDEVDSIASANAQVQDEQEKEVPSSSSLKSSSQGSKGQIFHTIPSLSSSTVPPLIDRSKLGVIVFSDRSKRKLLNSITHPRILFLLVKRLIQGCMWWWFSGENIISQISTFISRIFLWIVPWSTPSIQSTTTTSTTTSNPKPNHGHEQNESNNRSAPSVQGTQDYTLPSYDLVVADIPLLFESGFLRYLFGLTISVVITDPELQLKRLQERNPNWSFEECQSRINCQWSMEHKMKHSDIVIVNNGSIEDLQERVMDQLRVELMGRIYGVGMSLFQMLLLIGGSTSLAVSSKLYTTSETAGAAAATTSTASVAAVVAAASMTTTSSLVS